MNVLQVGIADGRCTSRRCTSQGNDGRMVRRGDSVQFEGLPPLVTATCIARSTPIMVADRCAPVNGVDVPTPESPPCLAARAPRTTSSTSQMIIVCVCRSVIGTIDRLRRSVFGTTGQHVAPRVGTAWLEVIGFVVPVAALRRVRVVPDSERGGTPAPAIRAATHLQPDSDRVGGDDTARIDEIRLADFSPVGGARRTRQ